MSSNAGWHKLQNRMKEEVKSKEQLINSNRLLFFGLQELLKMAQNNEWTSPKQIDRVLDWLNELDRELEEILNE
jgi:hypothetical protein